MTDHEDGARLGDEEVNDPERSGYWMELERYGAIADRAETGRILIRDGDRPWEQGPMAITHRYIYEGLYDDTAIRNWWVFAQDIREHSGSHIHQGGLVIYVLSGEGYTLVDGQRHDWSAGDLIMLPIKAGGVEHQHHNTGDEPSKWVAFIYIPFWDGLASVSKLTEDHPAWEQAGHDSAVGKMSPS